MKTIEETYDAECNECDWKGSHDEMEQPIDDNDVPKCPDCGSSNIYYYTMP